MKNKMLEQLKPAQSRRRGVAIEMAMLFLVVVVALSILLVSVSMMQIGKLDRANEKLEERIVLDQIGERFCRLRTPDVLPEGLEQEYYTVLSDSGMTLNVYSVENPEESVLTVELIDNNDGTYTVTKWSYGE